MNILLQRSLTLTAVCVLSVLPLACVRAAAPDSSLAVVECGSTYVSGVIISADGIIVAPELSSASGSWTVRYEGETYPARVIQDDKRYGLVLLKIDRQKPFAYKLFEQRQAETAAKVHLEGVDATGVSARADAIVDHVRRRIADKALDGSYYEINVSGQAPQPGALLVDNDSGAAYGVMIEAADDDGSRYVLFGSSVSNRAASANVVMGSSDKKDGPVFTFGNGKTAPATTRLLEFRAAAAGQKYASLARAVQAWRANTGFWINTLTTPQVRSNHCYFGATNGVFYNVDLTTMQREWVFGDEYPVFFAPTIGPSQILVASGDLKFSTWEVEDTDFLGFSSMKTKRGVYDVGIINCIDQTSGAFKWGYENRFMSKPVIEGSHVLFAGMGTMGVLDLATGKEVWEKDLAKEQDKPTYFTIAGSAGDKMWTLGVPTKLVGKNTKQDPFRLEQRGDAKVECYSTQSDLKALWTTPIHVVKDMPALSSAALMSPDNKHVYGATAKELFAVDAATGTIEWEAPTFSAEFAGNIAYGDSLLFAAGTDNSLFAVSAVDGRTSWKFSSAGAALCQPLVQDGVVYIGSLDTWLYALDEHTGSLIWKIQLMGKICGQPYLTGGKLYVMTDDGRLTELVLPQ